MPAPGGAPGLDEGVDTFDDLRRIVARCLPAGHDPFTQATSIWAGLHGFASLRQAIPAFPWPAAPDYVERLIQAHIVGAASQLRPPGSSARGSSGR